MIVKHIHILSGFREWIFRTRAEVLDHFFASFGPREQDEWASKHGFTRIMILLLLLSAAAHAQTPHTATWSINNAGCTTTTAACTAQIWRVVIPNGNCPSAGNAAYVLIVPALAPLPANVTPTNTHWDYTDSGVALTSGSVYCGYSTITPSGGGPGGASVVFQGTIPTPIVPPLPPPGISVILK